MRSFLVVVLLVLGGILALFANVGLWVDRTVYDTDGFVSTVDDVLDDPDVQQAIAESFTDSLFEGADLEGRLQQELPEGLKFLSLPLARFGKDFLTDASLSLIEREPFGDVRNEALRTTHSLLISIIEDESGTVTTEGDKLVLDLRPILEAVAEDVTGREVDIPEEGPEFEIPEEIAEQLPPEVLERLQPGQEEGLLAGLELSEDAGRFVIEDAAVSWAYRIARYGNDLVYVVVGLTVACFALAIMVAKERRSTLRTAGIILAVSGTLSLAALLPLGQAVRQLAENDAAATSIFSIVTGAYKAQSLGMIGIGIGVAAVAVLLGDSRLAVSIRSMVRRGPDAPSLPALIRERATALRVTGLVGAAVVLIAWPDPTTRVYVTTLVLLALYLGGLALVVSDARWAEAARAHLQRLWEEHVRTSAFAPAPGEGSIRAWVGAYAGWLRVAVVALAIVVLVAWPSITPRIFITVVALAFISIAAIDLVSNRDAQPPDAERKQD